MTIENVVLSMQSDDVLQFALNVSQLDNLDGLYDELSGLSILQMLAKHSRVDMMDILMQHQIDLDVKDRRGFTALHYACDSKSIECVSLLADKGASLDIQDSSGNTPLHVATQFAGLDCMDLLIRKGACIDSCTRSKSTPLHYASYFGETEKAKFLLDKGANIEARDATGWTPLHHVADSENDSVLCAEVLLSAGASISAQTDDYETVLHLSCMKNNIECARLFLKHNADLDVRDINRNTAYALANPAIKELFEKRA